MFIDFSSPCSSSSKFKRLKKANENETQQKNARNLTNIEIKNIEKPNEQIKKEKSIFQDDEEIKKEESSNLKEKSKQIQGILHCGNHHEKKYEEKKKKEKIFKKSNFYSNKGKKPQS